MALKVNHEPYFYCIQSKPGEKIMEMNKTMLGLLKIDMMSFSKL